MCLIILAGLPPTTVLFPTSLVTTAPAATTAFSPTVILGVSWIATGKDRINLHRTIEILDE